MTKLILTAGRSDSVWEKYESKQTEEAPSKDVDWFYVAVVSVIWAVVIAVIALAVWPHIAPMF